MTRARSLILLAVAAAALAATPVAAQARAHMVKAGLPSRITK